MEARPPRRRRWWLLAGAVGLLAVVVVGAVVALRAYSVSGRLAARVAAEASDALAGEVRVGGASASLSGRIELRDVTVLAPDGTRALGIERASVELSLWRLLLREVAIRRLDAEGVYVSLLLTSSGEAAVAAAASPAPGGEPDEPKAADGGWRVGILRASIARLVVEYPGARIGPATIALDDLAYAPEEEGRVSLGAGSVALGPSRVSLRDVVARELGGSPRLRATGTVGADLGQLAELLSLPALLPAEGAVGVEFHARLGGGETAVEVEAEGGDFVVAGVRASGLRCRGSLETDGAKVRACSIHTGRGEIRAEGRLDLRGSDHALQVVIDGVEPRALGDVGVDPELMPRRVAGTVSVSAPSGDALAAVELTLEIGGMPRAIAAYVAPMATIRGRVGIDRDALAPIDLTVRAGGQSARLRGTLPLGEGALDLDVVASDDRPMRWLARLAPEARLDSAHLRTRLTGSLAAPVAEGELVAEGMSWRELHGATARVPWTLAGRRLSVRNAELVSPAGQVTASGATTLPGDGGTWARAPVSGALAGELSLGELGLRGVKGRLHARGSVRGRAGAPLGTIAVRGTELTVGAVVIDELEAELQAVRDELLARADLRLRDGRGDLRARYVPATGAVQAALALHDVELASLEVLAIPTRGVVNGRVEATGTIAAPRVDGGLKLRGLELAEVPLGDAELSVVGSARDLVARARMRGPNGDLAAQAQLDLEARRVRATAHLAGVELRPFAALAGAIDYGGRVEAVVHVEGALPCPERFQASLRAVDLVVAGTPLPEPVAMAVDAAGEGLYRLELQSGDAIAGTALAHLGPPLRVEVEARLEELEPHRFLPALAENDVAIRATGDVHAVFEAPSSLSGDLELSSLVVTTSGQTVEATEPLRVVLADRELRVAAFHLRGQHGIELDLSGVIGEELDARLDGQLDVGLITAFVPTVAQGSGMIDVSAKATGAVRAPRIEGSLAFAEPVTLRLRSVGRELRLERGQLVATSRGAATTEVRTELAGSMDGGAFTMSGTGVLAGITPRSFDVRLAGQNLPFRSENLLIEANADLQLTGNARRVLVGGNVDIVRGRYVRKFELQDFNFVSRKTEVPSTLATDAPWLGNVELAVTATSEEGLQLRVDAGVAAVDLQLSSDVRVGGTALAPIIEGRVETSRGNLQFPKARLEVSQAVLEFDPEVHGNMPTIDLRADGQVTPPSTSFGMSTGTYFVTMELSGTLEEMALTLSSTPELNRLEVLALLVRGETTLVGGEGTSGDTSTLDAALAFAGSQLTGPLADFVEDQLEEALNLKLDLGAELTSGGVRVTASQQLTPRLRIQGAYERSLSTTLVSTSARARLLLTDRLFVEGSARTATGTEADLGGETSESRLELKWRLLGL